MLDDPVLTAGAATWLLVTSPSDLATAFAGVKPLP
jgi:hypothetical protein